MYEEFLRHQGFAPIAVTNGTDALFAAPQADVVVTGILLTGTIDGIELISRLRAEERTRHVPIVVLTSCVWPPEPERARRAGCDVFLPKPCLPEELLHEVRRVLRPSKLRRGRAAGPKAPGPDEPHDAP
jgi:chemosensory pili system protein ChpA (sensor histidine kinase/response regulator)